MITPTFFINGRRYDGPWDESSFADAMLGTLGHRVRAAALDFASWAPSAGILLLLATILAVVLTQFARWDPASRRSGSQYLGLTFGDASFRMSLLHWINDGLLTIFFLVVGLEIKREFTVGHLASRRSAALPIAGGDRRHGRARAALLAARSRTGRGRTAGACRWRPTRPSRWR